MNLLDWNLREAERSVQLGHDILNDLKVVTGGGPLAYILDRASKEAGAALNALVDVDPTEFNIVRKLQNEVQRHRDLVRWIGQGIVEAQDNEEPLSQLRRQKNADFLDVQDGEDHMDDEGTDQ